MRVEPAVTAALPRHAWMGKPDAMRGAPEAAATGGGHQQSSRQSSRDLPALRRSRRTSPRRFPP